MKKYKVSIIIPVYNVEKYIDRTLQSVLGQTLKDIQIILVDDKTEDKSGEICDTYALENKNIKVIHKKVNEGLGFARNSGIELAEGEYITFLDSDDTVDSDFYNKLYTLAKKYNSDVSMGNFKSLNFDGSIREYENNKMTKEKYEGKEVISEVMAKIFGNNEENMSMSSCRAIYKKELFEKYNIRFCSERQFISEDLIFQIDILPKCNIVTFSDEVYYNYYHDNNTSLTTKYLKDRFKKVKILHNEVVRKLNELKLYDLIQGENWIFNGNVRACIKQEKVNEKQIALKNIKNICEDNKVQEVVRSKYRRTKKQKIFDFLIQKKLYRIIYKIVK